MKLKGNGASSHGTLEYPGPKVEACGSNLALCAAGGVAYETQASRALKSSVGLVDNASLRRACPHVAQSYASCRLVWSAVSDCVFLLPYHEGRLSRLCLDLSNMVVLEHVEPAVS